MKCMEMHDKNVGFGFHTLTAYCHIVLIRIVHTDRVFVINIIQNILLFRPESALEKTLRKM
jgi:hypothetical protein